VLSKHAWAVPLKTKNGNERNEMATDRKDNSKMMENVRKICEPIWEKNFTNMQKLLKKHKSLFNIFHNEGICR